jgi:hypothetical protein
MLQLRNMTWTWGFRSDAGRATIAGDPKSQEVGKEGAEVTRSKWSKRLKFSQRRLGSNGRERIGGRRGCAHLGTECLSTV